RRTSWQLSPDGTLLAAQDVQGRLGLWEFSTGIQRPLSSDDVPVTDRSDFLFSPTGEVLGAAYPDGLVVLWDTRTGQQKARVRVPAGRLPLICVLSPDLTRVLTVWSPPAVRPDADQTTDEPADPQLKCWRVWTISGDDPVARLQHQGSIRSEW